MMLYGRSGLLLALSDIWNAAARYGRDEIERGFLRAELEMMMMMMMMMMYVCTHTNTHTNVCIYIYI